MKAPLIIFLLLAFSHVTLAQDNPVLPDLAPREVEITGELTISFPSLRRQPLVGFNPPPRIPDVPDARTPFAEEYLQRRADLPLSPLRAPAGPAVSAYAQGPRFDGSVEAGFGIYAQRYLAVDWASRASAPTEWQVKAGYEGRSGFSPVTAAGSSSASYDLGRFQARLSTPLGAWRAGGDTEGTLQSYSLYAALPSAAAISNPAPDRSGRDGSVSVWLARKSGTHRIRLEAGLGAGQIETDLFDPAVRVDPQTDRSDAAARVGMAIESGNEERAFLADASLGVQSFDGVSPTNPQLKTFSVLAGSRLRVGGGIRVHAGLRVLGFEADRAATGTGRRVFTWLSPEVRIEATPLPNLRVVVENTPGMGSARLLDLYRENPFAVDSPALEPELRPINASVRGVLTSGRLEFSLGTRWKSSPNRRYFEYDEQNLGGYERGISVVSYGRARELGAEAEAAIYIGAGFRLRLGGEFRSARLTDLDAELPYFAPWAASMMLSSAFDSGKGLVQVTGRIEGSRPIDELGTVTLDPFADVDVMASYRVTRAASAVLRLENLGGNRPEWDGYLRPAPLVTAGLLWQF